MNTNSFQRKFPLRWQRGLSDSTGFVESYFVRFLPPGQAWNGCQSRSAFNGQSYLQKKASGWLWSGVFHCTCWGGVLSCRGEKNIRVEGGQLLPRQPLRMDGSRYTCLRRLPGSQVPGLEPAGHREMALPLLANCVRWITSAICFCNHHQTLCVRNCQNTQTVIKILMKENLQPFIITE